MNNSNAHFSDLPVLNIDRSIFDRSNTHLTTFNAGKLVPVYLDEVLPGDSVTMDLSSLCRMQTPLFPVMDDAFLDFFFFFVPTRLVWDNSKYFFGESEDAWASEVDYTIPTVGFSSAVTRGSLFDHMGIPPEGSFSTYVNCLPFRAYYLIYNEWFRDQNLIDPVMVNKGDTDSLAGLNDGQLMSACKYHDYFTSCLPFPQKGDSVMLPLSGQANVLTKTQVHNVNTAIPLKFTTPLSLAAGTKRPLVLNGGATNTSNLYYGDAVSGADLGITDYAVPSNLYADLENVNAVTINTFRDAFAVQRLMEKDARGGTRYRELVKSHFGVDTGDARVQVPEYLGGRHISISVNQVVQQSATVEGSTPLGNTAAYSKTVDFGHVFSKSFTEHGYLLGLAVVRTKHTYQQGINRLYHRKDRFDFYWPSLAFIGEQPVMESEIFNNASQNTWQNVFGYQEAWADYRYKPNTVSGAFRSSDDGSLDVWHYADDYSSRPLLSESWIKETSANVDRTLAVTSDLADQFLLDCYFKTTWARPMPLYSIPGMRDYF